LAYGGYKHLGNNVVTADDALANFTNLENVCISQLPIFTVAPYGLLSKHLSAVRPMKSLQDHKGGALHSSE